MKYFSREKYINDPLIRLFKSGEELRSEEWADKCNNRKIINGIVTDRDGNQYEVSNSWATDTIEKKAKYYIILKGLTGYRGALIITDDDVNTLYDGLINRFSISDGVNYLIDKTERAELFKNITELKSRLLNKNVDYIFIFEDGKWRYCDKQLITVEKQSKNNYVNILKAKISTDFSISDI
jgi:hypothetical protein